MPPKKPQRRPTWAPLNLSLDPALVARLRAFCAARGLLLRPVVELAISHLLDHPPAHIPPPPERRGRPRKS